MTPEDKIDFIEKQIANCEAGKSDVIICPYCGGRNYRPASHVVSIDGLIEKPEPLCCLTFGKAVRAILQRQATQELADNAARIAEKVAQN